MWRDVRETLGVLPWAAGAAQGLMEHLRCDNQPRWKLPRLIFYPLPSFLHPGLTNTFQSPSPPVSILVPWLCPSQSSPSFSFSSMSPSIKLPLFWFSRPPPPLLLSPLSPPISLEFRVVINSLDLLSFSCYHLVLLLFFSYSACFNRPSVHSLCSLWPIARQRNRISV